MSNGRISELKPSHTRTSDGKKIDSWRVNLPDGHDDITVSMHSNSEGIHFSAKGDHNCLKGLRWEGTDLAELRKEVMEDVEKAAQRYYATDWEPAVAVEVKLYNRAHKEAANVQIELSVMDLHTDPTKSVGNRGETHVLKNSVPTIMLQRAHDEKFESGKGLDQENMRFYREKGVIASRTILGDSARPEAMLLAKTLEDFSVRLMRRTAPDVVRLEGLPAPEDLAIILREAIDEPEESSPEHDDPFL